MEFRLPVLWVGLVDLHGKDPLVDPAADWAQASGAERHRTVERHRRKRRTRSPSAIRARIRLRIWLACTGALLVMVLGIYLMLGREGGGGLGVEPGRPRATLLIAAA
jgi:hypothetical protein